MIKLFYSRVKEVFVGMAVSGDVSRYEKTSPERAFRSLRRIIKLFNHKIALNP